MRTSIPYTLSMLRLFSHILDFIFPKTCILCKKQGTFLCLPCIQGLPRIYGESNPDTFTLFDGTDAKVQKILYHMHNTQKKEIGYILGKYMYQLFEEKLLTLRMYQNFTNVSVKKGNAHKSLYTGFKSMDTKHVYSYIQNTENILYIHETYSKNFPSLGKRSIHLCLTN